MVETTAHVRPAYPKLQDSLSCLQWAIGAALLVVLIIDGLGSAQTIVLRVPCATLLAQGISLWDNGGQCNITEPIRLDAFVTYNVSRVEEFCNTRLPGLVIAANPTTGPEYADLTVGPCVSAAYAVDFSVRNERMDSIQLQMFSVVTSTLHQKLSSGKDVYQAWNFHTDVTRDVENLGARAITGGAIQGDVSLLRTILERVYNLWGDDMSPIALTSGAIGQELRIDNDAYLAACHPYKCVQETTRIDWAVFFAKIASLEQAVFLGSGALFVLVLNLAARYRLKQIKQRLVQKQPVTRDDETWVNDYVSGYFDLVRLARVRGIPLTAELLDGFETGSGAAQLGTTPVTSPHGSDEAPPGFLAKAMSILSPRQKKRADPMTQQHVDTLKADLIRAKSGIRVMTSTKTLTAMSAVAPARGDSKTRGDEDRQEQQAWGGHVDGEAMYRSIVADGSLARDIYTAAVATLDDVKRAKADWDSLFAFMAKYPVEYHAAIRVQLVMCRVQIMQRQVMQHVPDTAETYDDTGSGSGVRLEHVVTFHDSIDEGAQRSGAGPALGTPAVRG